MERSEYEKRYNEIEREFERLRQEQYALKERFVNECPHTRIEFYEERENWGGIPEIRGDHFVRVERKRCLDCEKILAERYEDSTWGQWRER